MKFTQKEEYTLMIIGSVFALYDFFSLPFKSFLITISFATLLFFFTKSFYFIAFIFLVPQLIRVLNYMMGKKENFTNPKEISKRIQNMTQGYKQEPFTNPQEISQRVESMKKKELLPKVEHISGLVNSDVDSIVGNPVLPLFMEQFENLGTNVNESSRIFTPTESSVPAVGTMDNMPRNAIGNTTVDTNSINTALAKTSNNNSVAPSNLKSVEIDGATA